MPRTQSGLLSKSPIRHSRDPTNSAEASARWKLGLKSYLLPKRSQYEPILCHGVPILTMSKFYHP